MTRRPCIRCGIIARLDRCGYCLACATESAREYDPTIPDWRPLRQECELHPARDCGRLVAVEGVTA